MRNYFFDTSALIKHYHPETGTARVDALIALPGSRVVVSRLTLLEINSASAKKVRVGQITENDFQRVKRQIRKDSTTNWQAIRILVAHLKAAEKLVQRIGLARPLRTLDAIQLAVALQFHRSSLAIEFVCSDHALSAIAASEGLPVINPETP